METKRDHILDSKNQVAMYLLVQMPSMMPALVG